ncbi:MAG TPA: diacylglycerol kinase family protein, partial [Acidimicrobiia bacterium]|nr:diacylglycerol kinase family protein [Acidimicrobiia bacterium]
MRTTPTESPAPALQPRPRDAHRLEQTSVAVIAHAGKSLDGGLPALREALANAGFADPIWFEVHKSKQAPKRARQACKEGADLIFVWGGDGMVQHCIDALAGSET